MKGEKIIHENLEQITDAESNVDEINSKITLLKATLPNTKTKVVLKESIVKADDDYSFTMLGTDRKTLSNKLLLLKDNLKDREFLAKEIKDAFTIYLTTAGKKGLAPPSDDPDCNYLLKERDVTQQSLNAFLHKVRDALVSETKGMELDNLITWMQNKATTLSYYRLGVTKTETALTDYCKKPTVYEYYLTALMNESNEMRLKLGHKSALLYAKVTKINLYVWKKNSAQFEQLELIECHEDKIAIKNIHLLHIDEFNYSTLLPQTHILEKQFSQEIFNTQQKSYGFFNNHSINSSLKTNYQANTTIQLPVFKVEQSIDHCYVDLTSSNEVDNAKGQLSPLHETTMASQYVDPSKFYETISTPEITLKKATFPNTQIIVELEEAIVNVDADYGFNLLGTDRKTLSNKLLLLKDNLKDREYLAEEIKHAFIAYITTAGNEGLLPPSDQPDWNYRMHECDKAKLGLNALLHKIRVGLASEAKYLSLDNMITWLQNQAIARV